MFALALVLPVYEAILIVIVVMEDPSGSELIQSHSSICQTSCCLENTAYTLHTTDTPLLVSLNTLCTPCGLLSYSNIAYYGCSILSTLFLVTPKIVT